MGVDIEHESKPAPHIPPPLLPGKCAVYVFSLSMVFGRNCPAGGDRVLKVGKVGPNSEPRFRYQHYKRNSAQSTLAASLLNAKILWPYLGIETLDDSSVGEWLKANTDRDHFLLNAGDRELLHTLEVFVRGLCSPVFEG